MAPEAIDPQYLAPRAATALRSYCDSYCDRNVSSSRGTNDVGRGAVTVPITGRVEHETFASAMGELSKGKCRAAAANQATVRSIS